MGTESSTQPYNLHWRYKAVFVRCRDHSSNSIKQGENDVNADQPQRKPRGGTMASSIIDSVMSFMGPQVLGPLASQLGVSTDTVQRGLQGGSAAILSGLAAKAEEPGFLSQI